MNRIISGLLETLPGSPHQSSLQAVPIDKIEIDQATLNIERKERSNLFPWSGQFSPQLIEALLHRYAPRGGVVLDPFAGSGTVLAECGRERLEAIAVEINPAACCMARTYELINCERPERVRWIWEVGHTLREKLSVEYPLFDRESPPVSPVSAIEQLRALSVAIQGEGPRRLFEALVVLLDLYRPGLERTRLMSTWNRLVGTIQRLPFSDRPLTVINADARQIPIASQSVDLVITSPPYINVFNYHQQYRSSAEFLGWDLLAVAKSEIGSNRKNRANRFLTVVQYCLDIYRAFEELRRVCKESAQVIFVVGRQSNVRKTPFQNGELVAAVATKCAAFLLRTRQERAFTNKFGDRIFEDILHFTIGPLGASQQEAPAGIAVAALEQALPLAPPEALRDLEAAIAHASWVECSPLYHHRQGQKCQSKED